MIKKILLSVIGTMTLLLFVPVDGAGASPTGPVPIPQVDPNATVEVMPEVMTPEILAYKRANQDARPLRAARAMSAGPAGWSFNWYSYSDTFVNGGGHTIAKYVVAVEEYRIGENYGVTLHRGYASGRRYPEYGVTGILVDRSAYSLAEPPGSTQVLRAETLADALDGGTCCATSRTTSVGVRECSFCGEARASGIFVIKWNGTYYKSANTLSNLTQANYALR